MAATDQETQIISNNTDSKTLKASSGTIKPYSTKKGILKTSTYAFSLWLCFELLVKNLTVNNWILMVPSTFVSIIASDLIAGIIHWILDNYRFADPVAVFFLGEPFVSQYSVHHENPTLLLEQNFWATNSDGLFATSVVLGLVYSWMKFTSGPWTAWSVAWMWFWVIYCIFTAFTNQFHKWSHTRTADLPKLVRLLQKYNVILDQQEHKRHHHDNKKALCLTTGWCNWLLEKLNIWEFSHNIVNSF